MERPNPKTAIGILIGVMGLLLYFMKIDEKGIVLMLFMFLYGVVCGYQLFRKKLISNTWGFTLLMLSLVIIIEAVAGLIYGDINWIYLLLPMVMYSLIYTRVYPKQAF